SPLVHPNNKPPVFTEGSYWRRLPESNRHTWICNPLRSHSAKAPCDRAWARRPVQAGFLVRRGLTTRPHFMALVLTQTDFTSPSIMALILRRLGRIRRLVRPLILLP